MAVRININLRGFEAELRRARNAQQQMIDEIDDELTDGAYAINLAQKQAAPVDEGLLKSTIQVDTTKYLEKELNVSAFYAAYIEFGTGRKTSIPSDYKTYAAQFKGKANRGNLGDMLQEIMQWVRRKGISGTYSVRTQRRLGNATRRAKEDTEVAYEIMLSILRNGVTPHPFFIPALERGKAEVVQKIKDVLKRYE